MNFDSWKILFHPTQILWQNEENAKHCDVEFIFLEKKRKITSWKIKLIIVKEIVEEFHWWCFD